MKVTIHNGQTDNYGREVILNDLTWETDTHEAITLCISALVAIGYSKENIISSMEDLINNLEII